MSNNNNNINNSSDIINDNEISTSTQTNESNDDHNSESTTTTTELVNSTENNENTDTQIDEPQQQQVEEETQSTTDEQSNEQSNTTTVISEQEQESNSNVVPDDDSQQPQQNHHVNLEEGDTSSSSSPSTEISTIQQQPQPNGIIHSPSSSEYSNMNHTTNNNNNPNRNPILTQTSTTTTTTTTTTIFNNRSSPSSSSLTSPSTTSNTTSPRQIPSQQPINNNINNNNTTSPRNDINTSRNRNNNNAPPQPRQQQQQQQQQQQRPTYNRTPTNLTNDKLPLPNVPMMQNQDTLFDVILQWGSLACSKLLFFPIEFPIHALTTFIQSNPSPLPQPIKNNGINHIVLSNTLNTNTQLFQTAASSFTNHISGVGNNNKVTHFLSSTSMIRLLKQKGYHIYDGGLVYLAHNMITILINFTQRSFNSIQNNPNNAGRLHKNVRIAIDLLMSLVKYGLTLPLDVLMTRLIVHRFYRSDNSNLQYSGDCTLSGICKNEGVFRGLYAGWEVIILKSIMEYVYNKLDNHLKFSSKRGTSFSKSEKSPAQIFLLGIKILLDYMLTVIKVRLNIRNIGIVKTVKNIISREGMRGLFAGLNTHFMLFPLWMIGILFANIIFIKVKHLLERSDISSTSTNTSPTLSSTYDDDIADSGLGVAMNVEISQQENNDEKF
eukprot:gene4689-5857_t